MNAPFLYRKSDEVAMILNVKLGDDPQWEIGAAYLLKVFSAGSDEPQASRRYRIVKISRDAEKISYELAAL